ncbi:MAG: repair protein RecO [Pseudomonadota bacterium]
MTIAAKQRIQDEQAFVLHTYPYRETSLIADVFSRAHGRVALMARGARRPKSAVRGVLMSFQPVLLSWFGRYTVRNGRAVSRICKARH